MTRAELDALAARIRSATLSDEGMTYPEHVQLMHEFDKLLALARKAIVTAELLRAPYEDGSVEDSWERLEELYAVAAAQSGTGANE